MDQSYLMDPLDSKQAAAPKMRRGYPGEDHESFRHAAADFKYLFPQNQLYPPSLLVRSGHVKSMGFPEIGSQEMHMNDPRYVPQDLMLLLRDLDDKRLRSAYAYPMATANGSMMGVPTGMTPVSSSNNQSTSPSSLSLAPGSAMSLATSSSVMAMSSSITNTTVTNTITNSSGHMGSLPFNGMMSGGTNLPQPGLMLGPPTTKNDDYGFVTPIPPLHVQQHLVGKDDDVHKGDSENSIQSKCLRCKKEFSQCLVMTKDGALGTVSAEPKVFKLCHHCRELQRQRSRRWQKKTKDKQGACRRCGNEIPQEEQRYVLCPQCRKNLRIRKANRAAQGKCVHCSGPIHVSIIKDEPLEDGQRRRSSGSGLYKVCQRCRENDRIRRTNLERMGNCNRCAKSLSPAEQGRHKVCVLCRQKKKKLGSILSYSDGSGSILLSQPLLMPNEHPQTAMAHSMSYGPQDSNAMLMGAVGVNNMAMPMQPQEYTNGYSQLQPLILAPDAFKPQFGNPGMVGAMEQQSLYAPQPMRFLRDRM